MSKWLDSILRRRSVVTALGVAGLIVFGLRRAPAATSPPQPARAPSPPASIMEPRVKFITTGENVVYRVGYRALAPYLSAMGDPRQWSLWCSGQEIPLLVKGEEDGKFNRSDYVEWYAPKVQMPYNHVVQSSFDNNAGLNVHDVYSTQGAYFLRFSPAATTAPLRLYDVPTTVPLKGRFWTLQTFRRFHHYEYDWVRHNFMPDPDAEYTDCKFWDYCSWPSRRYRDFYIRLVGLATDSDQPCSMTIKLWGENSPRDPPEHQLRISVNGTTVGVARWTGAHQYYFTTTTLSPKIFKEYSTRISVEALPQSAPDQPDMMCLDWIEIVYPSYYRAEDDQLEFVGPTPPSDLPGAYQGWLNPIALETFFHEPVWLLDLTAGERQELPLLRKWRLRGQDYYNVYVPIAQTGHEYVAYSPASVRTPAAVRLLPPDRLRSGKQGADYLIITHEKFAAEATRLAEHRTRLGLRSQVVTTDEIANSFNEGFTNTVAIRDFIRQAYRNWNPRPRFVLLVGDASWDDLGVLKSEFANYVPAYYYRSLWMGSWYASDNWFVALESSETPDLAIGRIPVRSLDETRAYVDKVIEYDTHPAKGNWHRSALLISSYNAYGRDQLNALGQNVLKGFDLVRCYATENVLTSDAYATTVTRLFDPGHALAVFAGHGGSFVWQVGPNIGNRQAPDLFSPRQVAQLTNRGKYPLVLALTCYTNSFDNPIKETIGESLILEPQRGAIAVISSTWRGALENEFPLAANLISRLLADPKATVGEALMAAKREMHNSENTHGVCLLGDPALRIYLDSRASNAP